MVYLLLLIIYTSHDTVVSHDIAYFNSKADCEKAIVYLDAQLEQEFPNFKGKWELKCESHKTPLRA